MKETILALTPDITLFCNILPFQEEKNREVQNIKDDYDNYLEEHTELTDTQKQRIHCSIKHYLDAYDTALELYKKIAQNQIPGLSDHLPLTKNKRLPRNRNLILWDSETTYPFPDEYAPGNTLQILIGAKEAPLSCPYEKHDDKGDLRIALAPKPKTVTPVLNKHGQLQSVTIQKATYLKDTAITPGGIYKQKTGKDLLYLGHLLWRKHGTQFLDATDTTYIYYYLPVTNDVLDTLQTSTTLSDFLQQYTDRCLRKKKDFLSQLRQCEHPKKFTDKQSQPLPSTFQPFHLTVSLYDSFYRTSSTPNWQISM